MRFCRLIPLLNSRFQFISIPDSKQLWLVAFYTFSYNTDMIQQFPENLNSARFHFVGIKGTGMTALAEILVRAGAQVSGSDVPDVFYTDKILSSLGIPVYENFSEKNVPADVTTIIYSAAYNPATNPELLEAKRRCLSLFSYPEALGALSRTMISAGIAGVHGKTTTTAMAGSIMAQASFPATILAGSAVASFGDRCTMSLGNRYFIAETCEYRRHFLNFSPAVIVLTSVESDHQDYYPTYDSILEAFVEYGQRLPKNGTFIYCNDDPGARKAAECLREDRKDLNFIPYGFSASGDFSVQSSRQEEGRTAFRLGLFSEEFTLHVPGKHLVLDAAGAIAVCTTLYKIENPQTTAQELQSFLLSARTALAAFQGSRRRSEVIGEAGGILFLDDYGHHPTAIKATLEGIKAFWPSRRLVVDFMSHTYSRTRALLDSFAESLTPADAILLHKIYPSARETPDPELNGRTLLKKVEELPMPGKWSFLLYTEEPMDALDKLETLLKPGDLFVTMGAGDNWKLGRALYEKLAERTQ